MRYAPLMPFMALLSACATHPTPDAHVPPFARVPYEPFSRDAVVAIALREWRLFGSPVDDDPPGTYRPASSEDKPERQQGLWQRVGEYWWLAMDAGAPEAAGPAGMMRTAECFRRARMACTHGPPRSFPTSCGSPAPGARFPYSASHSDYIDIAKQTWRPDGHRVG